MGRLSIKQKMDKLAKEEERLRQEQERIDQKKAALKQQSKKLKAEQAEKERKARTHRLIVIGGAVESVLGRPIPEEDVDLLLAFLKDQERRGKFFSRAMTREDASSSEVMNTPVTLPEDI